MQQTLTYLIASNRKGLGDSVSVSDDGILDTSGKHVVVIGSGNLPSHDCVRTAVRQRAKTVTCLYRQDRNNKPGLLLEVVNAVEEGINFIWLSTSETIETILSESEPVDEVNISVTDVITIRVTCGAYSSCSYLRKPRLTEGT